MIVPVSTPLVEYEHEPAEGVAEQIARYVARLVADGATLQIGLGRVPNRMLPHLSNRRALSIHSDVITEPVVDLVQEIGEPQDHRFFQLLGMFVSSTNNDPNALHLDQCLSDHAAIDAFARMQ